MGGGRHWPPAPPAPLARQLGHHRQPCARVSILRTLLRSHAWQCPPLVFPTPFSLCTPLPRFYPLISTSFHFFFSPTPTHSFPLLSAPKRKVECGSLSSSALLPTPPPALAASLDAKAIAEKMKLRREAAAKDGVVAASRARVQAERRAAALREVGGSPCAHRSVNIDPLHRAAALREVGDRLAPIDPSI